MMGASPSEVNDLLKHMGESFREIAVFEGSHFHSYNQRVQSVDVWKQLGPARYETQKRKRLLRQGISVRKGPCP
jgi:hypothetical protein